VRVYELARELGVTSRELLGSLEGMDHRGKTPSSNVPLDAIEPLRLRFAPAVRTLPAPRPELPLPEPELLPEPEGPLALAFAAGPSAARIPQPEARPVRRPELRLVEAPEMPTRIPSQVPRRILRAGLRAARVGWIAAVWTMLGLAAGLALSITLPYLSGGRALTVLSGSMAPAFQAGDVVVVDQIRSVDARVGDVVSFRDPDDDARLVTHRVRRIERSGTRVLFVTKGDANTSVERWEISEDGTMGRVTYRVPKIGYALYWFRGPLGRLILVVIPALLLGAYEIARIWRSAPAPGPREEASDGAAA
jgi:signal peptidase